MTDQRLHATNDALFSNEDELQALIAHDHSLLCGDQITPNDDPRRWILIGREVDLPDDDESAFRWRMDHLFIDQDAVPTIVEAKRGKNPEKRRTIIGQALEYAAYAKHLRVRDLQRTFEESTANATAVLVDLLESGSAIQDPVEFWDAVADNLQNSNLRLLLIADRLPPETHRVVEFLNKRLDGIDVFAIELENPGGIDRPVETRSSRRASVRYAPSKLLPQELRALPQGRHSEELLADPNFGMLKPCRSRLGTFPAALLRALPIETREATHHLIMTAHGAGGCFTAGAEALSIRVRTPAWKNPVSLAWLNHPNGTSHAYAREITLGYGVSQFNTDGTPGAMLTERLLRWGKDLAQFSYANELFPAPDIFRQQYWVPYSAMIDPEIGDELCNLLGSVIADIANLPAEQEPKTMQTT